MAGKKLIIAITGTPASGKSTFAKELSSKLPNSQVIELNDIVDEYKLFSSVDKLGSKIVKLAELESKMKDLIKEKSTSSNLIIVGHLVPEIELNQNITVVMRIGLKELVKRQEERKYPKAKIKENIVSESVDYCGMKAREKSEETYEVETTQQKEEITAYIISKLSETKMKPPQKEEISKFNDLLELIMEGNKYGL